MTLRGISLVISSVLILSGCQTSTSISDISEATEPQAVESVEIPASAEPVVEPVAIAKPLPPATDLWERIRRELTWQTIHNSQIGAARDRFLAQPDYMPVVSKRAELYLYYIVEEVERRGLPMEIALLPMIESTLNPFAYSSEHAAGLWQIIPPTAAHLGVDRNWWYDGRRDLRESTRIALDYLEALHAEFDDDWMLALAAYNGGKGRVGRARTANEKAGKPTDYWSLKLPRETTRYVPKLIALTAIIAYSEGLGVDIPPVKNSPAFEVAGTGGQIEMLRAADLAGMTLKELRSYNPGQMRWATAPEQAQELLVPIGTGQKFASGIAQLTPDDRVTWEHYRIRRGDSLIRIARQFDTDVGLLREVNNVRGNLIRAGDTMMIPQGSDWAGSLALASSSADKVKKGYRVRQGDSLYGIAGKFKVSIDEIINWNSLDSGKYLQPGQRLTLYISEG
ncbi:MAG: LysM peptidoglycan-binding domain-containing protein [Halioglobus sp.]